MRKWQWSLVFLFAVATGSLVVGADIVRQPLDIVALAKMSSLTNDITRAEMARVAGLMINIGQCKRVLGRYVGIDPQIEAIVTENIIRWKISYFDDYSRKPELAIKIEGAPIRSFSARWDQISQVKMDKVEDRGIDYLAVTLTKGNNAESVESVELPLEMQPAGYTDADVARVFAVLANMVPSAPVVAEEESAVLNVATAAAEAVSTNVVAPLSETKITQPSSRMRRSSENTEMRLKQLKELYEKGLLSQEIYLEKQREIMRNF